MLSLYDIQDELGLAVLDAVENEYVQEWVIDSRRISHPSRAIFIALKGELRDGHDFIQDAYNRGVRIFLVSNNVDLPEDAIIFYTEDTLAALQKLAALQRSRYTGIVVGVTGSYGKTILKEWMNQALSAKHKIYRSPKSYNSQIGVAISILEMDTETDIAILEAGISQPHEMDKLQKMIQPQVGILTSLGEMHQEGFESMEQKLKEKCQLFRETPLVYVGILSSELSPKASQYLKKIGVQDIQTVSPDYTVEKTAEGSQVSTSELSYPINFKDKGSVELSLLLYQILSKPPLAVEHPAEIMPTLAPISMRMEYLEGRAGSKIINDAYSLDPNSLRIALSVLHNQSPEWKKTLILSSPSEDNATSITSIIDLLGRYSYHQCILIGSVWAQCDLSSIDAQIHLYPSSSDFIQNIDTLDFSQQYILIKGARSYKLESVVKHLQLRKHAVSLEVNLNHLRENLLHYRTLLEDSTKIMVMVKAQSYGTGDYEIAKQLQNWGIDYLGVAYTDEGVILRQKGITLPIMVMNPEIEGIEEALDHGLEIEVYNDRILDAVTDVAATRGLHDVPIHLKLDTGMHRLGWTTDELPDLIHRLQQSDRLQVVSTFSHLYAADMAEGESYVETQITLYQNMIAALEEAGITTGLRHILNTAGVEYYSQYQMDMVRLGIGVYGLSHDPDSEVRNILTLKAEIAQISIVKKGQHLGYGLHTLMQRDSRIATVNIGYADGYMRHWGNGKAEVYIRGQKYPTMANVCMDMLFVDITDSADILEGDEVELLGPHIDIRELASTAGTISYEVITGLSTRIPRVYTWE